MVMAFFRRGDDEGLDKVVHEIAAMLADARHSFDVAMSTLVSGADPVTVGADVRATDQRINDAEQDVRRRLLVHASVKGTGDISLVLAYLLLSRKIERIGDQAKNILDLAIEGVRLTGADDLEEIIDYRDRVSASFGEVATLIAGGGDAEEARERANELVLRFEVELRRLIHTTDQGSYAVPRALLYRYLKRVAANLAGIVSSLVDSFDHIDYLLDGEYDTDD